MSILLDYQLFANRVGLGAQPGQRYGGLGFWGEDFKEMARYLSVMFRLSQRPHPGFFTSAKLIQLSDANI
jgi:hypothetical protein